MAAQKKRKKRKKNNSSAAYLGFLIVLAAGIVILLVLMAGIGSCVGKSGENDGAAVPSVSDNASETTEKNAPETEKTGAMPTISGGISGITANIPDVPSNSQAADNTAKPAAKIPYNPEEDWALYVVGNNNPLPENFTVETKSVAGERTLDIRCADYAIQMLNDAAAQNVGLFVTSSYRSIQKQEENLQSYYNTLLSRGYSAEEAEIQALKEIAKPGCSEHNAGLAMDIVSSDYWSTHDDLDESFEKLPQFEWLIANSWKYGFVLSYPKGKEDITGFIYEPWHYRFVGLKHAENMHKAYEETGEFLTVNEYIERYIDMSQQ